MGGRGRGGRGGARAAMSFNVEELGFRRGDPLPGAQLAPPPLFPQLLARPAPFNNTEELEYLQALKEDYRTTMLKSPHFLKADEARNSIERYSDKFKRAKADDEERHLWEMDAGFFPAELRATTKTRKKKKRQSAKPTSVAEKDVASRLDELEKGEGAKGDDDEDDEEPKPKKTKKDNDGDDDDDDEEDEEVGEDEEEDIGGNDYEQNYFDNGEDEANTSEDNLDEGGTY